VTAYAIDHVSKVFGGRRREVTALEDLCLTVGKNQRWGIVGESGSGKTTLLKILAGLMSPTSGRVQFLDRDLSLDDRSAMAALRSSVQMVFQDPRSSLNPRMKVSSIISEPLRSPLLKGRSDVPEDPDSRVREVLEAVGLPKQAGDLYPHEFSGGQRQRIAIARALAPRPTILLADEPVSALDVSVRAHVLNLLNNLVDSFDLTLIMVTHDLAVVRHTCDNVGVLRRGKLIESGSVSQVMNAPSQDYTKELLRAVPTLATS